MKGTRGGSTLLPAPTPRWRQQRRAAVYGHLPPAGPCGQTTPPLSHVAPSRVHEVGGVEPTDSDARTHALHERCGGTTTRFEHVDHEVPSCGPETGDCSKAGCLIWFQYPPQSAMHMQLDVWTLGDGISSHSVLEQADVGIPVTVVPSRFWNPPPIHDRLGAEECRLAGSQLVDVLAGPSRIGEGSHPSEKLGSRSHGDPSEWYRSSLVARQAWSIEVRSSVRCTSRA
jgi:hypothetical protein